MVGLSSPKVQTITTLLQSPQILNTTQTDQPDPRNQTPTFNGQRGIQRRERVIW